MIEKAVDHGVHRFARVTMMRTTRGRLNIPTISSIEAAGRMPSSPASPAMNSSVTDVVLLYAPTRCPFVGEIQGEVCSHHSQPGNRDIGLTHPNRG